MDSSGFRLKLFLGLFIAVMLLGTIAFSYAENISLLDAFYFSIVTIATVGYGDISPRNIEGKLLAIALIITGVGTFLEVIAGITQVMLQRRDKELRLEKLNMILGLFFSEIGTKLLKSLSEADPDPSPLAGLFSTIDEWDDQQTRLKANELTQYAFSVDVNRVDLEKMRTFLQTRGDFLLRLLENPLLLEQGSFTELLRAIYHFRDELCNREDLTSLPGTDRKHLTGDMERIYRQLTSHWLLYMIYLQANYAYLYSLAKRTNPFDRSATATIAG